MNARTGDFILRVPRAAPALASIMEGHGLDLSVPRSTPQEAVLFTAEPYAAVSFFQYATDAARAPLAAIAQEIEASRKVAGNRVCAVPDRRDLYPFQKAGMEYLLRRTNALVGDEPGLGKTPTAIVYANEIRARKVLVVCPANIRRQWRKRIMEWTTLKPCLAYAVESSADGVHPAANYVIVSYDLLASPVIGAVLAATKWDLVVLDECHYLKSPEARRTRCVFGDGGVTRNAGAVLALTGTPLPNRPKECFTIAQALAWESIDFCSQGQFERKYNATILRTSSKGKKYQEESRGRLPELQNRLRANFMVRRKKRAVYSQLPAIQYDVNTVDNTDSVRKALAAERLLDIDPLDLGGQDIKTLAHISTARQMMGVAKAPQVVSYAAGILDGGVEKLLVLGWHLEALDIIESGLKMKGWGVVRVDGRSSSTARELAVLTFQQEKNVHVFLGNLQSVGVGVDGLQEVCNRALFAECSWTPADNEQGIGRLERIGQQNAIHVEFLVAEGSLDAKVLASSLHKLRDIDSSLDNTGAF